MIRKLITAALLLVLTACGTTVQGIAVGVPPLETVEVAPPPAAIGEPTTVEIPALGVTDEVVPVGLNPDRTMQVPPVSEVGWYELGVGVGETGPAVLAGHVNYEGVAGSFGRIGELRAGDTITVTGTDGAAATFEVYDVTSFPKAQFNAALVYGDVPGPEIRLVTCSGSVVNRSYTDNTVVRGRLVS